MSNILSESDQIRQLKLQLKLAEARTAAAIAERDLALMSPKDKANQMAGLEFKRNTIKGQVLLALQNGALTAEDLAVRTLTDINVLRASLTRAKRECLVSFSKPYGSRLGFWALTEKGIAENNRLSLQP